MAAENQQRIVGISDTKANCTALTGTPSEIIFARATDTGEVGLYVGGSWYWVSKHTIQDEGVSLPAESSLNFVGSGVTALDDAGNTATLVTIETAFNVYNETITADGISTIYYLANYAAPSTIRVYIDGIRQPASDDVAPTDIVIFSSVPALGALLMFDYEMDLT